MFLYVQSSKTDFDDEWLLTSRKFIFSRISCLRILPLSYMNTIAFYIYIYIYSSIYNFKKVIIKIFTSIERQSTLCIRDFRDFF